MECASTKIRQSHSSVGSEEDQAVMIDFPEGIELYDIVWADLTADEVKFVVPAPGMTNLDGAKVIEVQRIRGSWGWTEELRVLVIFDGASVPVFETPWITDADISLECASGDRTLASEREKRINRWSDDPFHCFDEDDPEERGW